MPVPPKPADKRQRRNRRDAGLVPIDGGRTEAPAPLESWRPATVEQWGRFWGSPLASQVEESDHPALERLFRLYDEIERMWVAVEETGRVVAGSQGQPRPNPLFKQIAELQSEARQLEDRFGLSPMARLKLGITFADAHRSLDGLNERLAAKVAAQDDDHWSETS